MVKLLCAIVGVPGSAFPVNVDEKETVGGLKNAIKRQSDGLITDPWPNLQLFLAKKEGGEWLSSNDPVVISTRSGTTTCIPEQVRELLHQQIDPGAEVGELFGTAPPMVIHVLVRLPVPHTPLQPQLARDYAQVVQPQDFHKPRWKTQVDSTFSLTEGSLYFVNREQAVTDLCQVHREVFLGSKNSHREDAWPIALADNELGLGKSRFGKQYIRRCREEWPETVPAGGGFKESLCKCQTIMVEIDWEIFVEASEMRGRHTLAYALKKAMDESIARAVINKDLLELPDGAQMPEYLTSHEAGASGNLVDKIVRDFGPVFIVLDEIGRGFEAATGDGTDMNAEEKARNLFLAFCSTVLQSWMSTRGVFFLLLGYAPFLRNVGERKDCKQHASSKFKFVRLSLHLIRPNKITEIIKRTRVDDSRVETVQHRWNLVSDEDLDKAALQMYRKTCGHPRTMLRMLKKFPCYQAFCNAAVNCFELKDDDKEWVKVNRELHYWQPILQHLLPSILGKDNIDLSIDYEWPPESRSYKKVPVARVMERCHIGWEGEITRAKVYALPRILAAIASIVQPLRKYIMTIDKIVDQVTLAYATVLQWAFLKRFQELFSQPCQPSSALPSFFGVDTVFGKWPEVQFPTDHLAIPKITKAKKSSNIPTLDSPTASPREWRHLMDEIGTRLESSSNNCLCLKPLSESSSADVIFMRSSPRVAGKKRSLDIQTLTVGLAVKNYSTTPFGPKDLDDECIKFTAMFKNMESSTKTKFGDMTNVLFVCATNYCRSLQNKFHGKKYSKHRQNDYPIHVVLLDLTTPENRTEFFGLSGDEGLANVLNGLINKTERERLVDGS
ncbi:hypothetical protein PInf_011713 [Phytophthora infestans]|nr:hypothetical protein PInf_011713 [Phytophthora infestans]